MKRHITRLKHFLKDKNKKSFLTMTKEILALWVSKKDFPYHYFGRFFYRKNAPKNIQDYMTLRQYNRVNATIVYKNKQTAEVFSILDDKLELYKFCKENKLPTPEIFSNNINNTFYFNKGTYKIKSSSDLKSFYQMVMQSKNVEKLFIKPTRGSGGDGAFILTKIKLNRNLSEIFRILTQESFIHQEVVSQHDLISAIYDKSINTMRLETFLDRSKTVHLLGSFMRFGSGNQEVDNASQGGFKIMVDLEKGVLFEHGITKLIYGGKKISKHPDSGIVFKDFQIPFFKETIDLAMNLGKMLPCYVHGWDIAFTNFGPIIIEGNYSPGILGSEASYFGYKNKTVFKEIMEDTDAYFNSKKQL